MSVILQCFNWRTHANASLYKTLQATCSDMRRAGFTHVWYPPASKSRDPEGYYPLEYYDMNSAYGSECDLIESVASMNGVGLKCIADIVSWYEFEGYTREAFTFSKRARQIEDPRLFDEFTEYVKLLTGGIGFGGIRVDCLKAFPSNELGIYFATNDTLKNVMMVGELWDAMSYNVQHLEYNQDAHRQRVVDYIDRSNGRFHMFDFTSKGVLQEALNNGEYWRLCDCEGRPSGVIGYWPQRSVTFVDNHDTLGQHLWACSYEYDVVLQAYAYILTHPGVPCVYIDHYHSHRSAIEALIGIRNTFGIDEGARVQIVEASAVRYHAIVEGTLHVAIGDTSCANGKEELYRAASLCLFADD